MSLSPNIPGSVEDPVRPGRHATLVTGVVIVAEQVVLVRRGERDVTLMEALGYGLGYGHVNGLMVLWSYGLCSHGGGGGGHDHGHSVSNVRGVEMNLYCI